jgi:DNA polymerase-4
MFGKRATNVRDKAMGLDNDAVHIHSSTKSISSESTFANDLGGEEELRDVVERKAVGVAHQLEKANLKGRTVKLKLRLADFTTFARQVTLPYHTDAEEPIKEAAWALLEAELEPGRTFRLIGVGVANFEDESEDELPTEEKEHQLWLFTDGSLPVEVTD